MKKICIERIINTAIHKNTQKATQFGMSVFNGEYTDFFCAMFEKLTCEVRNLVSNSENLKSFQTEYGQF